MPSGAWRKRHNPSIARSRALVQLLTLFLVRLNSFAVRCNGHRIYGAFCSNSRASGSALGSSPSLRRPFHLPTAAAILVSFPDDVIHVLDGDRRPPENQGIR